MSSIEGGDFNCDVHQVTIAKEDVETWNKHCLEEGHTMHGTSVCQECGAELRYKKHPYIPLVKETGHLKRPVQLFCENCDGNNLNPRTVEVQLMSGATIEHKDTNKT